MFQFKIPAMFRNQPPFCGFSDDEIVSIEGRQTRVFEVCTAVLNDRILRGIRPGWEDGSQIGWDDLELDLLLCISMGIGEEKVSIWQLHNDFFEQELLTTSSEKLISEIFCEAQADAVLENLAKKILTLQEKLLNCENPDEFFGTQVEIDFLIPLMLSLVFGERVKVKPKGM